LIDVGAFRKPPTNFVMHVGLTLTGLKPLHRFRADSVSWAYMKFCLLSLKRQNRLR